MDHYLIYIWDVDASSRVMDFPPLVFLKTQREFNEEEKLFFSKGIFDVWLCDRLDDEEKYTGEIVEWGEESSRYWDVLGYQGGYLVYKFKKVKPSELLGIYYSMTVYDEVIQI